jgi:hypothetical protein
LFRQRFIFYINNEGIVQAVWDKPDDANSWTSSHEYTKGRGIELHPSSGLAAVAASDGIHVFFQLQDNSIGALILKDTQDVTYPPPIDIGATTKGSPLSAFELQDKVHLFYVHEENKVRDSVWHLETGERTGEFAVPFEQSTCPRMAF